MALIKYLYIDDEQTDVITSIAEALSSTDEIEVKSINPIQWNEQIKDIENRDIDGLILDLRLDREPPHVSYRGLALAQEIRTLATENKSNKDIPIVLCSAEERISVSYRPDMTGHDLIDEIFIKGHIDYKVGKTKLIDLANGYKILLTQKLDLLKIFNIQKLENLDERFVDYYNSLITRKAPVHEFARFILNEVIRKTGLLIDEDILAVRLGIDKNTSSDWKKLLKILENQKYTGVFGNAWKRWWMNELENWWNIDLGIEKSLRSMSATEKVNLVIEKTGLQNLKKAEKIRKNYSEQFWTICQGTNQPIDIIDACKLANQDNNLPWQDYKYIAIETAIYGINKQNWGEIHPFEKQRIEKLKKLYKND